MVQSLEKSIVVSSASAKAIAPCIKSKSRDKNHVNLSKRDLILSGWCLNAMLALDPTSRLQGGNWGSHHASRACNPWDSYDNPTIESLLKEGDDVRFIFKGHVPHDCSRVRGIEQLKQLTADRG